MTVTWSCSDLRMSLLSMDTRKVPEGREVAFGVSIINRSRGLGGWMMNSKGLEVGSLMSAKEECMMMEAMLRPCKRRGVRISES